MPVYALVSARSIDALVSRCEARRGAARERYARCVWLFKRARVFLINLAINRTAISPQRLRSHNL